MAAPTTGSPASGPRRTTNLPGTELPGLDFVALAAGYGIEGRRVETAAELDGALTSAFATAGPNLIEVETERLPSGMFSS